QGGEEKEPTMTTELQPNENSHNIKTHALPSRIKAMLSGPGQFAENEINEVNFRDIPSHALSKVCRCFTYEVRGTSSSTEIPVSLVAAALARELLMAANSLDC
uniref:Elongin-C n=2 Tax=Lynx TaxID=13124 RepID=A0A667I1U7_LYNCA